MQYRRMETIGKEVSLLGFGCMRYPVKNGAIDKEKAGEMLDFAIKSGVNYIDTAYVYHDGLSESVTAELLQKYPRESFHFATKLPAWEVNSIDDAERIFEEQLKRLKTDYIDFYLLHSLNAGTWEHMLKLGVVDWFENLKKRGRVKYIGFSFHDEYPVFSKILNYKLKTQPKWDFCQIHLNYMDATHQAGLKGYNEAAALGVPVVIMEPIKGGSLSKLPDDIFSEMKRERPNDTASAWALRWVASNPGVKVILSGMSSIEQVRDNVNTLSDFTPLTESENSAIEKVSSELRTRVKNNCTGCKYCMPCPAGVNIPVSFMLWNEWGTYQMRDSIVWKWSDTIISGADKPKNCIDCGKCEKACPQGIAIRADLKKVQSEIDALL